jgi:hypothetical protein
LSLADHHRRPPRLAIRDQAYRPSDALGAAWEHAILPPAQTHVKKIP